MKRYVQRCGFIVSAVPKFNGAFVKTLGWHGGYFWVEVLTTHKPDPDMVKRFRFCWNPKSITYV